MKAQFVYESIDFERGKNPYDALDIGNRVQRLASRPMELPLFEHLFHMDEADSDIDKDFKKEYRRGRSIFLKYAKFAAVLDYMLEKENNLPDSWSEIDEQNVMLEGFLGVVENGDDEETFKQYVIEIIDFLAEFEDIDTEKYKDLVNRL
jgi:hypothetical protein